MLDRTGAEKDFSCTMKRPGFTYALTQQRTSVGFSLDKRQDLRLIKLNEYLLFAMALPTLF